MHITLVSVILCSACTPSYSWTPPTMWDGSDPAAYRNFDDLQCIIQMRQLQPASFPLIPGKVIIHERIQ